MHAIAYIVFIFAKIGTRHSQHSKNEIQSWISSSEDLTTSNRSSIQKTINSRIRIIWSQE